MFQRAELKHFTRQKHMKMLKTCENVMYDVGSFICVLEY